MNINIKSEPNPKTAISKYRQFLYENACVCVGVSMVIVCKYFIQRILEAINNRINYNAR